MPVPWPDTGPAAIPQVERRAINVQQLRNMKVFLQRLCKIGMLRDDKGERISWFNINMYDICNLVIKPVISYVTEQRTGTPHKCSWVEFVARGEQPPLILFSHSWAGRFRDFMDVVECVARDRGLRASVAIWICTFANSQFGEDFGTGLRQSPFYKAIEAADEGTILVVDRGASSLTRIWCGFEVYLTTREMGKKLRVYTSMGRVGTTVTSGSLVDEVERWDVRRMEASQDSDRRQILNYLCQGVEHENDGLLMNDKGELVKVNGWQNVLSKKATTTARLRRNGDPEYQHESDLFDKFSSKINALNEEVQREVREAAKMSGQVKETGCRLASIEDRGVTLREIRRFEKNLKEWAATNGIPYSTLTVSQVTQKYLTEEAHTGGRWSYAEGVSTEARRPQYVVQESWSHEMGEILSSIEWFAEAARLPDSTVFHFAPLCKNFFSEEEPFSYDDVGMLLGNSDGLLSIMSENVNQVVRFGRMRALQYCFENAINIYLGCSTGVLACTTMFQSGLWQLGHFCPKIGRILLDADWEAAALGTVGDMVRSCRGGIESFKHRVARAAAGAVLRDAARVGVEKDIHDICKLPGFTLSSPSLRGGLHETAVHLAAGAGHLRVLRVLLDYAGDPAAEDHIRETPMHYAAMGGHVAAVRLLLKWGASASAESAFAETPLVVAEQNPCGFLGVRTCRVVALLRSWESASEYANEDQQWMHKPGSLCCGRQGFGSPPSSPYVVSRDGPGTCPACGRGGHVSVPPRLPASLKGGAPPLEASSVAGVLDAFKAFDHSASGTVCRSFVEGALERLDVSMPADTLDPFTDMSTNMFRYAEFINWLYAERTASMGAGRGLAGGLGAIPSPSP